MGQALGTGYLVIDKSQPQCIVLSVRSTLSSKCEPFWQKKTKTTMALMPNSMPQNGSPKTDGWCNDPNICSLYTVYGRNTTVTLSILPLHHTLLVDYLHAEEEVWRTGAHEWLFVLKARQLTGKSIKTFQCSIINHMNFQHGGALALMILWQTVSNNYSQHKFVLVKQAVLLWLRLGTYYTIGR